MQVVIPSLISTLSVLAALHRTAIMSKQGILCVVILQVLILGLVAAVEKVKREYFVLFSSSAKTKKQLMTFFNLAQPCAFVSDDGTLRMFNESFEGFVLNTLGLPEIPSNILTIQTTDPERASLLSKIKDTTEAFHLG